MELLIEAYSQLWYVLYDKNTLESALYVHNFRAILSVYKCCYSDYMYIKLNLYFIMKVWPSIMQQRYILYVPAAPPPFITVLMICVLM